MSTKESLLLEKTFNDADGTMRRVFYTLTQPEHLKPIDRSLPAAHATASRTAKLLSLLIEKLEEEGRLTADELDEMLLKAAL